MENLRGSFSIVPGAAVLAALGAGVLLPRVHVASDGPWASYVFTGGDAAVVHKRAERVAQSLT